MTFQRNIRIINIFAWCGLIFCVAAPVSLFAEPNTPSTPPRDVLERLPVPADAPDQRIPRRSPPQVAIDACKGKEEGDPCTFLNSRDGILNGDCHAGLENVFACRPHRSTSSPESLQRLSPDQGAAAPPSQRISQPEAMPQAKARTTSDKLIEPPRNQSSDHQVSPLKNEPVAVTPPIQADQRTVPATHPAIEDNLGRAVANIISYMAVALTAAALTWYLFFRYVTVPLRLLRKVTQQLAGGNLSARVGEGLVHRKDEVAGLGRDVDRMAERIESLVGAHQRLIRDVSHELRSPLARLNVALELARQSAGPAHVAPFDRIERESDRLNELIGQLLMLTKLESESGSIKRMQFDIAALITEIAQDADFEAKSNGRRVETNAREPLLLTGSKELLRQAVENVVRNAVRYTAEGTSVMIELGKKETGGRNWAHIGVRDYGPGVPESQLTDIFRPFYRVNDARERQSGGTGVGLAISDRAVRIHGGSLRAYNAPGAGLIMEMELPLG